MDEPLESFKSKGDKTIYTKTCNTLKICTVLFWYPFRDCEQYFFLLKTLSFEKLYVDAAMR